MQADGRHYKGGIMQTYANQYLKIYPEGYEGLTPRKTKLLPGRMKLCRKFGAFEERTNQVKALSEKEP